ncbi:response regulator transcription factor [Georgenia satyanarayanai]|uniref:response regulator transcription factor n=1 Tax=Georgenia satyanarayanai TaxID=860221 RepID=UPI0012643453|nr:response regulator transcription factor [Georgenia satyanarayanai]
MTPAQPDAAATTDTDVVDVLLYSDDVTTREQVRRAIGRRAAVDVPRIRWTEAATHEGVVMKANEGDFALIVLDGEAAKAGGMAVSRQLKSEMYQCPPVLILTARPQDAWLATWAQADAIVQAPVDPIEIQEAVAGLLRSGGRR